MNNCNGSPITLNLTSHGVERNSLAELVGISALAAESYGANTWFGDRERKVITLLIPNLVTIVAAMRNF